MKKIFGILFCSMLYITNAQAQQPVNTKGMTYILLPKPNNIIYHDTVYTGVRQFSSLFYRTRNPELIALLDRHQSNKIAGQVCSFAGTIATIIGVSYLSSADQKGLGWGLIGGGFAATLTGGYLLLQGQRNLQMAVSLFNQKNTRVSLGLGTGVHTAGLVYQF